MINIAEYERERERHTVKIPPRNGKRIRREQHRNHPPIPKHADELERLTPPPKTPLRLWKARGGAEQARDTNQAVGRRAGDAGGGDERGEGDVGREDGAGDDGRDEPDDDDGVARLAGVHARHPAGEGEDAVAGYGEDEARGGRDGDGCVLFTRSLVCPSACVCWMD